MDIKFILPRITWLQGELLYGRVLIPEDEECEIGFLLTLHIADEVDIKYRNASNYNDIVGRDHIRKDSNIPMFCIRTEPKLLNSTKEGKEYAFTIPIAKDIPPNIFHNATDVKFLNKMINIENCLYVHLLKSNKIESVNLDIVALRNPPKSVSTEFHSESNHIQISVAKDSLGLNDTIEGELKIINLEKKSSLNLTAAIQILNDSTTKANPPEHMTVTLSKALKNKKMENGQSYKFFIKTENFKRFFHTHIPNFLHFQGGIYITMTKGLMGMSHGQKFFLPLSTGVQTQQEFTEILPQYLATIDMKPFKSKLQIESSLELIQTPAKILNASELKEFTDKTFGNHRIALVKQEGTILIDYV